MSTSSHISSVPEPRWVAPSSTSEVDAADSAALSLAPREPLPEGEFVWDLRTGAVSWSEGLYEVFELAANEGPQTLEEYLALVHPDDRERVQSDIEMGLATGEGFRHRQRTELRDGTVVWIDSRAWVEREDEDAARVRGVCRRVTDRAPVSPSASTVSGLVHDLRNLLHIIGVNMELVRDAVPSSEAESVGAINDALRRATRRVTRLTSVGGHAVSGRGSAVDLSGFLDALAPQLSSLLPPNAELLVSLTRDRVACHVDVDALAQAVMNVVRNAGEAVKAGGTVRVMLESARGLARIVVVDDGRGMGEDELARALDPGYRGAGDVAGRGVGLCIAAEAAEAAGGYLVLDSALGEGTRVEIGLPLARE